MVYSMSWKQEHALSSLGNRESVTSRAAQSRLGIRTIEVLSTKQLLTGRCHMRGAIIGKRLLSIHSPASAPGSASLNGRRTREEMTADEPQGTRSLGHTARETRQMLEARPGVRYVSKRWYLQEFNREGCIGLQLAAAKQVYLAI